MKAYLENIIGKINEQDWSMTEQIIRYEFAKKNDYFLEEGMVCRDIWFLSQGAARSFELKDGTEHTTRFFMAPCYFTDYHSLLSGKPTDFFFKAEEDCSIQRLPYPQLFALYEKSHALERVGRIMAEFQFMTEIDLRRMHLNMDARERYEYVEANQPELLQRFQLKDIASYLGITPVSLSRLRKSRLIK